MKTVCGFFWPTRYIPNSVITSRNIITNLMFTLSLLKPLSRSLRMRWRESIFCGEQTIEEPKDPSEARKREVPERREEGCAFPVPGLKTGIFLTFLWKSVHFGSFMASWRYGVVCVWGEKILLPRHLKYIGGAISPFPPGWRFGSAVWSASLSATKLSSSDWLKKKSGTECCSCCCCSAAE